MTLRNLSELFRLLILFTGFYAVVACQSGNRQANASKSESTINPAGKRIGMVIKIDSSQIEKYLALRGDANPGVRDLLVKYHLRNFTIFMTRLDDGNYYEFGYYEYQGTNYEADMAAMDAEPRNKQWLKICDPLQIPLKGETSWRKMKQIFFNK